jgi:hypothetical protein
MKELPSSLYFNYTVTGLLLAGVYLELLTQ